MNAGGRSIDHYLMARAEAMATGANAHAVHALLGIYVGLTTEAQADPAVEPRRAIAEQRLRVFCQTGRAPAVN